MNISELIRHLEIVMENEGDLEVRIAYQPSYPLAAYLTEVTTDSEAKDQGDPDDMSAEPIVWLAASEGVQYNDSPYAPRGCWSN